VSAANFAAQGGGRFTVAGDLSFATVPALWAQSRQAFADASGALDIDLKNAQRADSAGLALLVTWTRWAREGSKTLRFSNAPRQVATLAQANKLTKLLALQPDAA
jgi:phospholipid transport system transporter-binding protein